MFKRQYKIHLIEFGGGILHLGSVKGLYAPKSGNKNHMGEWREVPISVRRRIANRIRAKFTKEETQ